MDSTIRFIHSADLHLDSLFKTKGDLPDRLLEKLRASTFEAFDRLIDACIEHQVDFLVIAGDLYNEEIRSLKAQVHLRRGFERLNVENIQVYMSFGNHDYTKGTSYPITFPDNVHIFSSEEVDIFSFKKNGETLAHIYGFSYERRAVRDRKVKEYIRNGEAHFHIGLLHGSLETNTDHDVYAPFSLEEMKNQGMDYWALGHIHKREVLSEDPPIIYPGNIQGRSRKEMGEKGCYLIEEKEGRWNRSFLPLQSFTYNEAVVSCDFIDEPQGLERVLEEAKAKVAHSGESSMLSVVLQSTKGMLRQWWMEGVVEEWVEVLNEAEDVESGSWVWIDHVKIEECPSWNEDELMQSHHFTGELLRATAEVGKEELDKWLAPLFSHRKLSKYITPLSHEEEKEAVELAKTLAVEQLLSGEADET